MKERNSEPYEVEELDGGRAILHFRKHIIDDPRRAQAREVIRLIEQHDAVACDLSQVRNLNTGWIRVLGTVSLIADDMGKIFGVTGIDDNTKRMADMLGTTEALKIADSPEEVWQS